ncbi:MAG: hypothetical protein QNJ81_13620 [Acidimicrobiia bacterium]|nr:hypothetical protein [Acidimicrobiia bacterium]
MRDSRDPEVRAAVVELGMAAAEAPTWERIVEEAGRSTTPTYWMTERRLPNWAVALAAAVVVLVAIGGTLLVMGPAAEVAETPTTIPPPTTAVPTTAAPPATTEVVDGTAEVEALVAEYYAAYNAGDVERALALLSTTRDVNPLHLEYWIKGLGEQVDGDCVPSTKYEGGLRCIETYSDNLHGPAGETAEAWLLYFADNGLLRQLKDPDWFVWTGCRGSRCPGTMAEVEGSDVEWSYSSFEADLFSWLELNYPQVAAAVGDPGQLHYFAHDEEAAARVMPFVVQFVASSAEWGPAGNLGADLSELTVLEAVAAGYAAFNSHDPELFADFFGEPPNDATLWFWELGRTSNMSCEPTSNPNEVLCTGELLDNFYVRAGAIFEFSETWTMTDDFRLISALVEANSSGYWAYDEFEAHYWAWMLEAYPEDAALAYAGENLIRTPEAAAIAMRHLDEFLDQSDIYPRSADPRDSWFG